MKGWPGVLALLLSATVLADDPGSSVLTLTSRGMTELSRPYGAPDPLPIVGMWKDAKTGDPVPLRLPPQSDALVLCLTAQYFTEWTADGRDDQQGTAYPVLSGVHAVKAPRPLSARSMSGLTQSRMRRTIRT